MTGEPRAFLTIDAGAATTAVALIGRVDHAWRLIAATAWPAAADEAAGVAALVRRVVGAEPDLADGLGIDADRLDAIPTVRVASTPPRRLAVVAASERSRSALEAAAGRSGWVTVGASVETTDPVAMTRLLLDARVDAILAGAGDPAGADERGSLAELTALVAAAARRRPDRPVALAGAMATGAASFDDGAERTGGLILAPAARPGAAGGALRALLTELALPADDARRALATAAATLAEVLDRRIELVEVGYDGGARIVADPGAPSDAPHLDAAFVPSAGLAPASPDDATVDAILAWTTVASDRHRLRDRMRELRIAPWSDLGPDGVALRLAAARAALSHLAEATPEWGTDRAPDLVIAAGGVWSIATPAAVGLALADVLRRPGISGYALDQARLLGPLGSIPDADERRAVMADLVDDLLIPIGSIVTPAGLHAGRSAGTLDLHAADGRADARNRHVELAAGGLQIVPLTPGTAAVAEFRFRDGVRLGARGRHFAVDVAGGLAGLVLDLRDVPLHLPDRADRRRELLDAWATAVGHEPGGGA